MASVPTVISLAQPFDAGAEIVVAVTAVVFVATLARGGFRSGTRLRRRVCAACGTEAYTLGRRPPRECKRVSRPVGL